MSIASKLCILTLWIAVVFGSAASAVAQTFTVNVPLRRTGTNTAPPYQITKAKVTLSVVADRTVTITGVRFNISANTSNVQTFDSGVLTSSSRGGASCFADPEDSSAVIAACSNFTTPPASGGITPTQPDVITIYRPFADLDNAHYQRWEIDIEPLSNENTFCTGTQISNPDVYTIQVTVSSNVGPAPQVLGVCIESYDRHNPNGTPPSCGHVQSPASFLLPLSDTNPATLVPPTGAPAVVPACFKQRPLVDAMLVLDKSGSMADLSSGGGAGLPTPRIKIEALQKSVSDFVSAWNAARSTEPAPPSAPPTPDQIGVVLFDSVAAPWADNPPGLTSSPLLNHFSDVQASMLSVLATCNVAACGGTSPDPSHPNHLVPGTSTSIGAGLLQAYSAFTNDSNRPVILLMTDGMQNTDPRIKISGGQPSIYCDDVTSAACTAAIPSIPTGCSSITSASPCPLTKFNPLSNPPKIYTVTVGYGTGVADDSILQPLAHTSGGFYINTELDASLLSPFFLELLQNILKFHSYETVQIVSGQNAPFTTSIPLSATSRDVEFSLMWPANLGMLRLTITPPGQSQPIVKQSTTGFISIVQPLTLFPPFDSGSLWRILVQAVNPDGTIPTQATGAAAVPFNLLVMADDGGVKTDLSIEPGDYTPRDRIFLHAKLTEFGTPILGLGAHPDELVVADLVEPGKSLGDILSDSSASPFPLSSNSDIHPGVEAKLFNTLQGNPLLFTHDRHTVQLFDDGKPEHGDAVANDGIYSGVYQPSLPGHYTFLFKVEGRAPNAGHFARQQLKTAFVRPVPDSANTVFNTSILRRDGANVFSIVMTPRFKPSSACAKKNPKCGRMGPGWANYFWFTSPSTTPFKAKDNLDGTYTASLPFTGALPSVTAHFENVLAVIDDSATSDRLPQPLDSGNAFTLVPPPNQGTPKVAVFLNLGAGIPHGTFSSAFNTGFSLNAGLEYIATSHFSVEGLFGYDRFPANVGNPLDLYQFSANGKLYLTSSGPLRPFVNGGIGGYKFSGNSTYFGGNLGAGVLREFGPHWGLQASYNFHAINTPGAATKFSTVQGGLRFVF